MSSNTSKDNFNYEASFDCSYYLGHGIELPTNDGYHMELNPTEVMAYADGYVTDIDFQDYSFSAARLKQFELTESSRNGSTEDYYPLEYSHLLSCMNQSDLEDFTKNGNEFSRIRAISDLEDALLPATMTVYDKSKTAVTGDLVQNAERLSSEELLWKQIQESELLEDVCRYEELAEEQTSYQSTLHLQNLVEGYLEGFGEKPTCNMDPDHLDQLEEDQNRKRRLCRHFLKGHCKRGKACDFLHDPSIFCPNSQKVFLGGLPAHITEATLRQKLAQQGYKVINKPKVLRGFTPQVCLASIEEAQKLIEKRNILIDGSLVDVRAYEAFAKGGIDESRPDEIKRSVFLGGLSKGTNSQMIKDDLQKMDVKVINHPLVKTGFTPKVTFGTVKETNMLIKLKKVRIHDTLVDVRPYVNFKSPFRSSKKKQNKAQLHNKEHISP